MEKKNPLMEKWINEDRFKIYDIAQYFNDKIPRVIGPTGNEYVITNIRALVIHQDLKRGENVIEEFVPRMIKEGKKMFHYIIDDEGNIFYLNQIDRCIRHCNYPKYSKVANQYFGDHICPITPNPDDPQVASPDICTLSICIPESIEIQIKEKIETVMDSTGKKALMKKNEETGVMEQVVSVNKYAIGNAPYNSLVNLCCYLINAKAEYMEAQANILGDYYFGDPSSEKPDIFFHDQEKFNLFRYAIERKRKRWQIRYGKRNLYCPPVEILVLGDEEKKEDKK